MATTDDTSKPSGPRSKQPLLTPTPVAAAPAGAGDLPPVTPPRTLEEALENARTLMMQLRGVLHCLSDVLLYSDDDDAIMHAEVARSTAGWAQLAAAELDPAKLQPLIEAIRQSGGGTPDDGEPDLSNHGPYGVREPRAVYLA